MKSLVYIFACGALTASAQQVGRFQLFSGPAAGGNGRVDLYKIDTVSGRVWKLDFADLPLNKGDATNRVRVVGWDRLDDDFQVSIKAQLDRLEAGPATNSAPTSSVSTNTPSK